MELERNRRDLTRQVILQDTVEAYAIVLLVLDAFTTVHNSIPLQGTDKVEVSYFPLQATASTSFVSGTGYTTASDWIQNSRDISVGGDGNSATSGTNAAAGTARDRLYQMLMFRSYDMARMPYLNAKKLVEKAANKLGVDMVTQVIQRVITKANFSDAIASIASSVTFSADDVATLREYCTGQNGPQGRSLVIDHTRYTPLLKDPSFKQDLSYGDSDPIQGGHIENAYGFKNIIEVPNLGSYSPAGENLVAWVNHKSAVLVATAPIMPSPEVLNLLSSYSVAVDPRTGAALSSAESVAHDRGWGIKLNPSTVTVLTVSARAPMQARASNAAINGFIFSLVFVFEASRSLTLKGVSGYAVALRRGT